MFMQFASKCAVSQIISDKFHLYVCVHFPLMKKIRSSALRIICMSFLKIIDFNMHSNGYENDFHLIDHTVIMTDQCDSYNLIFLALWSLVTSLNFSVT